MNKSAAVLFLALLCCCGAAAQGLSTTASAWATVATGRYGGTGFGTSLSLAYTDTIAPRLTLTAGGYLARMQWRSQGSATAGLAATLSYRFDEHWEADVFVQKSLMQPQHPLPWAMDSDFSDKIGAAVQYHFNPSLSVSLSVWEERRREPPLGWLLDVGRHVISDQRHGPPPPSIR